MADKLLEVKVDKYTVFQNPDGTVHALRNGDWWRDCTGDNLVLSLAQELGHMQEVNDRLCRHIAEEEEQPERIIPNDDNDCIDEFAEAMKIKMAQARDKGRDGWWDNEQCSDAYLAALLLGQIEKADASTFVDIGIYAMMLFERGANPLDAFGDALKLRGNSQTFGRGAGARTPEQKTLLNQITDAAKPYMTKRHVGHFREHMKGVLDGHFLTSCLATSLGECRYHGNDQESCAKYGGQVPCDLEPGEFIQIPRDRDHAAAMLVVAERWLKDNGFDVWVERTLEG